LKSYKISEYKGLGGYLASFFVQFYKFPPTFVGDKNPIKSRFFYFAQKIIQKINTLSPTFVVIHFIVKMVKYTHKYVKVK